ncbi:MAG: hypothetical protein HXY27_08025 [Hydrogenophilaceae bacterium]|nr:hypothetical protein [Hydrogenophilaceae bacterium]
MKYLLSLFLVVPLAGCISFNSSDAGTPDYASFCENKEAQCREICGSEGVQAFSCKAAPREGLDFKCECKKATGKSI